MGFINPVLNIAIYNKNDTDHDHKISESEFVNFVHDHDSIVKNLESKSSNYIKMFEEIDVDKSGSITPLEFNEYLTKHPDIKDTDKEIVRKIKTGFKLDANKRITLEGLKRFKIIL